MATYTVAFMADNAMQTVQVDEIKPADGYVRCQSRINDDDVLAGVFPFESIEYIVHNEVSIADADEDSE